MASPSALEGLSACECPVCFNILSEETNAPMSMPCGHTLCSTCIDRLVSKATSTAGQLGVRRVPTFQCPLCREWINRDAVHLNITLRDLLVELSRVGKSVSSGGRWLPTQHVDHADIEFGSPIDRGAYGEVFRGVWQGNDVAIKVFSAGLLTSEGVASFQREVFVMNCLRHPNVVLLLGACQTPPKLSIIMEYVAGGSLHKLIHIDKVALSSEDAAAIGLGVCRGLQYLHSINILHRDLKSKNVLLTGAPPSGTAKLCDFGLARMRMESATMTGNVGTVHWSAPEVLSNQRYQFPADVYGLGMVLYEMAYGRVPFQDMMPLAVMMAVAIQRQQPEMPTSANPKIVEIIKSCILWDPSARSSVSAVISELMTLLPKPKLEAAKRPSLQHQDSLGVVFVSATDSSDLANDNLIDIAKEMGLVKGAEQQLKWEEPLNDLEEEDEEEERERTFSNVSDYEFAQQLQENEQEAQLERDRELAEQLQMKENTYRKPIDDIPMKKRPPQVVLDSLKQIGRSSPILKTASNALPAKKKATPTKQMAPPTNKIATKQEVVSKKAQRKSKVVSSRSPPPAPQTETRGAPPPPPPPPLVSKPRPHPSYQRSRSVTTQRRVLLEQVRTSGRKVASKLRPVVTIEKRAFKVGHVVDGYSSEASQFTTQNLIKSFNRRLLKHIELVEPRPPFPLGTILPPKRGEKVKRVSQIFQSNGEKESGGAAMKKTTPTHRLHPAIQSAIESFPYSQLEHVKTDFKQSLPNKFDIDREKKEIAEAEKREQVSSDDEELHGFW